MIKSIILLFIGALFGSILAIIFRLPQKWVFDRYPERCTFGDKNYHNKREQAITITKIVGKTSHIDCGHWKNIEKIKSEKGIYFYCTYGTKIDYAPSGKSNRKCPFA